METISRIVTDFSDAGINFKNSIFPINSFLRIDYDYDYYDMYFIPEMDLLQYVKNTGNKKLLAEVMDEFFALPKNNRAMIRHGNCVGDPLFEVIETPVVENLVIAIPF